METLLTWLLLLNIVLVLSCTESKNTKRPEITYPRETLIGKTLSTRHGRNVFAFLGIPYGQPPIGNLRFANPVAADRGKGIHNASEEASSCLQVSGDLIVGDENCLYLNVYTPQLPNGKRSPLFPVMMFVHGGGFIEGSASPMRYGPEYILDEDVLLVTFNYRLGPFGFLSTGDEAASGNWALKDQILALTWVHDYIEYFGGDPDQVTLFGHSSGSVCVHLLTLLNATVGLFHRSISQSGSAFAPWSYRPRTAYAKRAFDLGEYVGCFNINMTDSLINCLRAVNATDIVSSYSKFRIWESYTSIIWGPTDEPDIEGAVLTSSPMNLIGSGQFHDIPRVSGVTENEGLLLTATFYENATKFENFLENFDVALPVVLSLIYQPDSGATWVKAMKSYYFNDDLTGNRSQLLTNLTLLIGDTYFVYPAFNEIRKQLALAENRQYLYSFNYRGIFSESYVYGGSTANYGVAHGDDLIYLFPRYQFFKNLQNETMSDTDFQMVDIMVQLWTSFAINGTPITSAFNGVTTWESYSTEGDYLQIGNQFNLTLKQRYYFKERMQFWDGLVG